MSSHFLTRQKPYTLLLKRIKGSEEKKGKNKQNGGFNMALTLTSSDSSTLEPLRQNRWIMQFQSIPGGGDASKLAFVAKSANAPAMSFAPQESHRLNEKYKIAGKPSWNDITMTFYDYIRGADSAGDIMYNWMQRIYNPITGQMFFKKQYSTTATLAMLDPAGGVVRLWNLFYLWPNNIVFGDGLAADAEGLCEVSVTFSYDYAIKSIDIDSSVAL